MFGLELPMWAIITGFVYMILEYVVGKTDWIEANSIPDILIRLVMKALKKDTKV